MAQGFTDKRFLITGAASGIGLACARLLKSGGARLMLWDQNAEMLAKAAAELNASSARVDVTSADEVQAALEHTLRQFGQLDGVIHSAGVLRTGAFEAIDPAAHRRIVDINLFGTIHVAHALLPHLRQTRGSLVLLGSTSAFYGTPEFASYAATKAAVLNLAQGLRIELADSGVHVGIVNPLLVNSPMLNAQNRQNARLVHSKSPLVTLREPPEIAAAILRGIQKRQFMIHAGYRERLIYWISRYAAWAGHSIMQRSWVNAPQPPAAG